MHKRFYINGLRSGNLEKNMLTIQIPKFQVEYLKNRKYAWSNKVGKENLKEILSSASKGYCMYCYRRIVIDGQNFGHLEHSIEKDNSINKLTDCIPNISISCSSCNTSLKKKGEKGRKLSKTLISEFEQKKCTENCTSPCREYEMLKSKYIQNKEAQIILQPSGVKGFDTGEEMQLEYDILDAEFRPSTKYLYSEMEMEFMKSHIIRFRLNEKHQKTRQLISFLEDTINNDGRYTTMEYNHLIVELFVEKLQGKTKEEVLKICTALYELSVMKFYI